MRTRFAVLLTLVAFVLLLIPPVSQAFYDWDGTEVNYKDANPYTHQKSVGIAYNATVAYTSSDLPFFSLLYLRVTGDVVLPSSGVMDPDKQGHSETSNGSMTWYTLWCSGDADLPLKPGDGVKEFAVVFFLAGGMGPSPQYIGEVTLDTHGPKTIAPYPLTCKKGGYATVSYQVEDSLSPTATVSLRVTNARGKTVSTASIGEQETGKLLTYLWKCGVGKGRYTYSILATDAAGNEASKAGKNTLTVK